MSLLSRFFGKKSPLDVPLDQLKESQIKLEVQIQKIEDEIAAIDREITLLFEKAKQVKTKAQELTIATKIKTLNKRKQNLQKTHAQLNKQLMFVNNLMIIKVNQAILEGTPMWDKLRKMSPEEHEEQLTNMQLDAQTLADKLNTMIAYTDQTIGAGVEFEEDEELAEIMEAIHAVKEGELEPGLAKDLVTGEEKEKKKKEELWEKL